MKCTRLIENFGKLYLLKNNIPPWPCPFCWKTHIKLVGKLEIFLHDVDEPEYGPHPFVGKLRCDLCEHNILMCGKVDIKLINLATEKGYERDYFETYYPEYFSPNLKIFHYENYYPKPIKLVLDKAFSLFFCDIYSSANKIRVTVEKLLDLKKFGKIKRCYVNKTPIPLYKRIDMVTDTTVRDRLKAIKWIGNYGAHLDEKKLTQENLLDAFEILHVILEDAFSQRNKNRKNKVKKINKKHPQKNNKK